MLSQAITLTCRRFLRKYPAAAQPCRLCCLWVAEKWLVVRPSRLVVRSSHQREQPRPVDVTDDIRANRGMISVRPADIERGEVERQPLSQAALQEILVPIEGLEPAGACAICMEAILLLAPADGDAAPAVVGARLRCQCTTVYHRKCVEDWFESSGHATCPTCRQTLSVRQVARP